jgi:molybdopterin molybdotransferase
MNSAASVPPSSPAQAQRKPLRALDDALAELLAAAQPLTASRHLPLAQADGCVLAHDVVAQLDVPGFDNASVDGYALSTNDAAAALSSGLPQSARIPAGHFSGPLVSGTVARIFTGAPLPSHANAVVMQEDCELVHTDAPGGELVRLQQAPTAGQNIRLRGEDIACGQVVVAKGTRLTPAHLGLLASIGQAQVEVLKPVRVALLSTGDELVMPGTVAPDALPPGAIFSSNGFFLSTLLKRLGAEVTELAIVADTLAETTAALQHAASAHDVVLSTGGVSVGEEDHVKPAVQSLGSLDLWALAIKPGKPFAYGRIHRAGASAGVGQGADFAHFVGLPGNPVSSFVTFVVLVRPFIDALLGVTRAGVQAQPMTAHFNWPKPDKRREFLRVKRNAQGGLDLYPNQSSGVLTSVAWADGFVDNPPGQVIAQGDTVSFWPMSQCM